MDFGPGFGEGVDVHMVAGDIAGDVGEDGEGGEDVFLTVGVVIEGVARAGGEADDEGCGDCCDCASVPAWALWGTGYASHGIPYVWLLGVQPLFSWWPLSRLCRCSGAGVAELPVVTVAGDMYSTRDGQQSQFSEAMYRSSTGCNFLPKRTVHGPPGVSRWRYVV